MKRLKLIIASVTVIETKTKCFVQLRLILFPEITLPIPHATTMLDTHHLPYAYAYEKHLKFIQCR